VSSRMPNSRAAHVKDDRIKPLDEHILPIWGSFNLTARNQASRKIFCESKQMASSEAIKLG
jgi:hypothetical protein